MLAATNGMVPLIILATDGSVKDERQICDMFTDHLDKEGSASTRISTFGIGEERNAFGVLSSKYFIYHVLVHLCLYIKWYIVLVI